MSEWIKWIIGISGVDIVMIIIFLVKAGGVLQQLKTLIDRHEKCPISTVKEEVAILRRENDLIWGSISISLADAVRQHANLDRDQLIDKMNGGAANENELHRLYTILRNDFVESRVEKPAPQVQQVANAILMARVQQKLNREHS